MAVSRHFLSPQEGLLLPLAVEYLLEHYALGRQPLDLRGLWVVVPTRTSGRELRKALALRAAQEGTALLAPEVVTPDVFLTELRADEAVASAVQERYAWIVSLMEAPRYGIERVLGRRSGRLTWGEAEALADRLMAMRQVLGGNGHTLGSVQSSLAEDFIDGSRWQALAELEVAMQGVLQSFALRDGQAVLREALRQVESAPWQSARQVVVLGVPDPSRAVRGCWQAWCERVDFDVVVYAEAAHAERFDGWGVPLVEFWLGESRDALVPMEAVTVAHNPAEASRRCVRSLQEAGALSAEVLSVALLDEQCLVAWQEEAQRGGVASYQPEGVSLAQTVLGRTLRAWYGFLGQRDFWHWQRLWSIPEVVAACAPEHSLGAVLASLDACYQRHKLADWEALLAFVRQREMREQKVDEALRCCVQQTELWLAAAQQRGLSRQWLEDWIAVLPEALWSDDEQGMLTAVAALRMGAQELWAVQPELPLLTLLGLLLHPLERQRYYPEKEEGAVELLGWLELLWCAQPNLALLGLNEGMLSAQVQGDVFLPESLRVQCGLSSNEERRAVDAYVLSVLPQARREGQGCWHAWLAKFSNEGDPLRPEPLLLWGEDAALLAKVERWYGEVSRQEPLAASERDWPLRVPRVAARTSIAVTSLSAWLACPFRYYLQHVLPMPAYDLRSWEMNAMEFGSLLHGVLERYHEDTVVASSDEGVVDAFLQKQLRWEYQRLYGTGGTIPLRLQYESLAQRLRAMAPFLAQQRREGWQVRAVECAVEQVVTVDDVAYTVKGKIDALEYHEEKRCWRIVDFKSSEKAVSPVEAHIKALAKGVAEDEERSYVYFDYGGKRHIWKNLQLPLYYALVRQQWAGDEEIVAGYVNVPKAVSEVGWVAWRELDDALAAQGVACMQKCVQAMHGGKFWPPVEKVDWDGFADLFQRDLEEEVVFE